MAELKIEIVRVPLLNANEDELIVTGVHAREGQEVRAGALLFSLESTKATSDVEAPIGGFVRRVAVREGDRVAVGAPLCVISEQADVALPEEESADEAQEVRATVKARRLAEAHGVDLASLRVRGIIKEKDVRAAIGSMQTAPGAPGGPAPSEPALLGRPVRAVVHGAGGHAKVLVDLIRQAYPGWSLVGALDDGATPARELLGLPVLGGREQLLRLREEGVEVAALGIGAVTNNKARIPLFEALIAQGFLVPNLIHPRAAVEPSARMGRGNQIFAHATVGSGAVLGDNTIINSGVVVSHDCRIGSHVHLTPGAILAGGVTVGENSVIGMGVTIYLGVTIGRDVVISNGVHVMADVPDGALVRAQSRG